jgi:hypothetical protein
MFFYFQWNRDAQDDQSFSIPVIISKKARTKLIVQVSHVHASFISKKES